GGQVESHVDPRRRPAGPGRVLRSSAHAAVARRVPRQLEGRGRKARGGCGGLNGADTVSYDAALLSQAVGRPVRIQLSRKDENSWENYGSAVVIDQRVGVDASGTIVAWDYEAWV